MCSFPYSRDYLHTRLALPCRCHLSNLSFFERICVLTKMRFDDLYPLTLEGRRIHFSFGCRLAPVMLSSLACSVDSSGLGLGLYYLQRRQFKLPQW